MSPDDKTPYEHETRACREMLAVAAARAEHEVRRCCEMLNQDTQQRVQLRTWHVESTVVATLLAVTAAISGGAWYEWVGAAAVWCGFSHASVAERMREQEATRPVPSVDCYRKLGVYFIGREIGWAVYFLALGAWSALVGCGLFAAYPVWRRYWRKRHPLPSRTD